MITVQPSQFNGTQDELAARVEAFRAAVAAHAMTVGVPAPIEEDWVAHIVKSGDGYALAEPPEAPEAVIPDWGKVIIAELANKPDASKEIIDLAATSNIAVAEVGRLQPLAEVGRVN